MMCSLVTRRVRCVFIKSFPISCWSQVRPTGVTDSSFTNGGTESYRCFNTWAETCKRRRPGRGFFFLLTIFEQMGMSWGVMHEWCRVESWNSRKSQDLCQTGWYPMCSVEEGRLGCSWSNRSVRIEMLGWKNRLECQLCAETQLNRPDLTCSPTRYISLLLVVLHVKELCNATVTQTTPSLRMIPIHPTLSPSSSTYIHRSSRLLRHVRDAVGGCSRWV